MADIKGLTIDNKNLINEKNIIQVRLDKDIRTSNLEQAVDIDFNEIDYNIGNAFALVNGKVRVIKDNIHHVKIHFHSWVESLEGSYCTLSIQNSKRVLTASMKPWISDAVWMTISLDVLSEASLGEEYSVFAYWNILNALNGIPGRTYKNTTIMIVEAID